MLNIDRLHTTKSVNLYLQVLRLQGFAKPSIWNVRKVGGVAKNSTQVSCCHGKYLNHCPNLTTQDKIGNFSFWFLHSRERFALGKPSKEKNGNILVFYQYGVPPLARIGNFRFFLQLFSRGGGHNWEKKIIHFLHVLEHIDHF